MRQQTGARGDGTSSERSETESLPLDRVVRIAEFRAALRTFLARSEKASRTSRLTPQRYLLLLMIKGAPDRSERLSITQLARRLKLSINSVTELVGRAEQAGLIRRETSSSDRRVVQVRLTAEGESRLDRALAESEEDRRQLALAMEDLIRLYRSAAESEPATSEPRREDAAT